MFLYRQSSTAALNKQIRVFLANKFQEVLRELIVKTRKGAVFINRSLT